MRWGILDDDGGYFYCITYNITEVLWGTKVSPGTISNLNKKAYGHIEVWRNR